MKETFSYYVVLELRADTEPEENAVEVDIVKNAKYYGGESGLYGNLTNALEVMEKRIEEIAKDDDWDTDEDHCVSYYINGLDGYVYLHDINNKQNDWVYKRFFVREVKF